MTTSSSSHKIDYVTVTISFLSFVVLGLPSAMLGIAWLSDKWPSMQKTFNLSLDSIGLLLLALTIGYSLASFLGGQLYNRFNSSTLFILGSLVSAIALLGYGTIPEWRLIIACGVLLGLGSGILDAGMNIYFAAAFDARLMNWLHACYGIGTVIGPLLMTTILSIEGGTWQTGFIISAGAYASLAILFLITKPRWLNVGLGVYKKSKTSASIRSTLRLPLVWVSLGIFLSYAGLEGVATQWIFPLFNKARGIDVITAGTWLVILQASFTVGRIFFGFILAYMKPRTLIRLCSVTLIIATFLLVLNPIPKASFIILAVYGFTLSPIWALMVSNLQEQLGSLHGANAIGFMLAAAGIGLGILPGISGIIADNISLEVVPLILFTLSIMMMIFYEMTIRRAN